MMLQTVLNDRISFFRFACLSLDDRSPDHSSISQFRTEVTKNKAYEILLSKISNRLQKHHLLVKNGEH